jgi:hypothetical protein
MSTLNIVSTISSVFIIVIVLLAWAIHALTRKLAKKQKEYVELVVKRGEELKTYQALGEHYSEVSCCYGAMRVLTLIFLEKYPFEAHEKPLVEWIEQSLAGETTGVEETNKLYMLFSVRDRLRQRKEMAELKQKQLNADCER